METISISAVVLSILAGIGLFFKYITKCKCSKNSVEFERDNPDVMYNRHVADQQKFVIELIQILKDYKPKKCDGDFTPSSIDTNNITTPRRGAEEIAKSLNLERKKTRKPLKMFKTSKNKKIPRVDTRKKENSNQNRIATPRPISPTIREINSPPTIDEINEIQPVQTNFITKKRHSY